MRGAYTLKRVGDMSRALWIQQRSSRHERWARKQLEELQRQRFLSLLRHALELSPFYAELYRSYGVHEGSSLEELPVVNKRVLVDHFDRVVTDSRLRLPELQEHLTTLTDDDYYLGEYRVVTTAGSSGEKAVFAFNRREWSVAQAAGLRIGVMTGIRPRFPKRLRVAVIGSDSPLHLSYRLALTLETGLIHIERAEATKSVDELVGWLNEFQPDVVEAYPFILGFLAAEQLEGALRIRPRTAVSAGEALAVEIKDKVRRAWGITPFDVYGTTEGLFAVDCPLHWGIHIFEDLSIVEVVDRQNRPVPAGTVGSKLLLTNLFGYTKPVIRYEVDDMVTATDEPCACGRTFRRITAVEGRSDDVIYLEGVDDREVPVAPAHFWAFMEGMEEVKQYQIIHKDEGLEVRLVLRRDASEESVAARATERFAHILQDLGVRPPPIRIVFLDRMEQDGGQSGKMKLVTSKASRRSVA